MQLGSISVENLSSDPENDWFKLGYDLYSFKDGESYRKLLAARMSDVEILGFVGVWCGDTHDHLPGFVRILDAMKFPRERLKLFALDRTKSFPGGEGLILAHSIKKLPTFTVLRSGREIGRITETPEVSLLADLARILD